MENSTPLLVGLRQTAEAIVSTFGKNCEVCIHDLTDLQNSLIFIAGNITGRKVGAPATDLLVKELQKQGTSPEDMYNYKTTTQDGRTLKSSTIFFKNEENKPVVALCINFDTTDFFNAVQAISPFLDQTNNSRPVTPKETFALSTEETIHALFHQAVKDVGKQPATMTTEEKIKLVELLELNGAFLFKGAVDQVAVLAGVSKHTIYNYLKKIRTLKNCNQL